MRIGAIHNVVYSGFSPTAVRERLLRSQAKVLVTVDEENGSVVPVKQLLDDALHGVRTLGKIVVVQSKLTPCEMRGGRDCWYHEIMHAAQPECPPEPMPSEAPLFILYASGGGSRPAGILHTTGGYLVGVASTHRNVFDLKSGSDVYWCTADIGDVTGHSYVVYGPLANGATSIMYEGTPDRPHKGIYWDIIDRYKVSIFYTQASAIKAFVRWGTRRPARHSLGSLRLLGSFGEPLNDEAAWRWYRDVVGGGRCPIVDTWCQAETGAIVIATLPGAQQAKPGSTGTALPGICGRVDERTEGSFDRVGQLV